MEEEDKAVVGDGKEGAVDVGGNVATAGAWRERGERGGSGGGTFFFMVKEGERNVVKMDKLT